MLTHSQAKKVVAAVAIVAVLFGIATLFAGGRVLLGSDPGYVVYLPLLRYNTIMGAAYVAVGVLAWRTLRLGVYGAAAICVLNLAALAAIGYLYTPGGPIAAESIRAMTFRTAVWVVLFLALLWSRRRMAALHE